MSMNAGREGALVSLGMSSVRLTRRISRFDVPKHVAGNLDIIPR